MCSFVHYLRIVLLKRSDAEVFRSGILQINRGIPPVKVSWSYLRDPLLNNLGGTFSGPRLVLLENYVAVSYQWNAEILVPSLRAC